MKKLIDERIVVLRQDYKDEVFEDDKEGKGGQEGGIKGAEDAAAAGQSQGDGTQIRPYINCIEIKVSAADVMKLEARVDRFGREELIEQKFRVTKGTSFLDMKREACIFWNLDPDEFTLVLPNKHDVMSLLAGDEGHIAYTLAKYFEIHRDKRAVLHLVRP